jgi:FkbM family methyltransferase
MHKAEAIKLPFGLGLLRHLPIPHKLGVLERLYGDRLKRNGIAWVSTSTRVLWKLNLADVCERWIVYGDYEGPGQMRWLRRWLSRGGTVIDSGANIGQVLLYLAPQPGVRWFAFEPLPVAADWLDECLALYREWSVEVVRSGLSDSAGTVHLQVDGARSTARMDWYKTKNLETLALPMTTLDRFLDEHGLDRVRLWKLDVEGHELNALEGARRHLEGHRIDAILIELTDFDGVSRVLGDCGYVLHRIDRHGSARRFAGSDRPGGNLLALPED